MSTNGPTERNGCGIDYEHLARQSKADQLDQLSFDLVDEPLEDFLQALREGEGDRDAYLTLCNMFLEFLTFAGGDLDDLGGFDRAEPRDLTIARAFDVAGAAASGRHDLAKQYGAELEESVEQLEVSDDA